jgi:TolA-binding protein
MSKRIPTNPEVASMPHRNTSSMACRIALPVTAVLFVAAFASTAAAQQGRTPFSDYQGRRGLSPYTALGFQGDNPNTGGALGALQNIIRPQQLQAAQVRQQQTLGRQLNGVQGQVKSMQRGGGQMYNTIRATGHSATFQNTSHFYPNR